MKLTVTSQGLAGFAEPGMLIEWGGRTYVITHAAHDTFDVRPLSRWERLCIWIRKLLRIYK